MAPQGSPEAPQAQASEQAEGGVRGRRQLEGPAGFSSVTSRRWGRVSTQACRSRDEATSSGKSSLARASAPKSRHRFHFDSDTMEMYTAGHTESRTWGGRPIIYCVFSLRSCPLFPSTVPISSRVPVWCGIDDLRCCFRGHHEGSISE